MSVSRRRFLGTCLGAAQLALLNRFGVLGSTARAAGTPTGPTKLLTIFVNGGLHFEHFISPFPSNRIGNFLPNQDAYPFYPPEWVENWDGSGDADSDAAVTRLRGPVWWNWDAPWQNALNSDEMHVSGRKFDPKGYSWASPEYRIFEDAVFINGIDQQTAAHESGIVAATCGLAGSTYAAPAVQAVVANYFANAYPDRVIPSAVIGRMAAPAVGLSSVASPKAINALGDMEWTLSDRRENWEGLRLRSSVDHPSWDDQEMRTEELTQIERFSLESLRQLRNRSSAGTDTRLEQLHDSYVGLSRALAQDVVGLMESTPGFEYLTANHPSWITTEPLLGWRIGYANGVASGNQWRDDFDLALRFLKTNLASSVSVRMHGLGMFNFDTHYSNPYEIHSEHLHGVMETIGQFLCEMKSTPSPERAGKTLLDDTLVYIYSDFGRTFQGSDHNPMTSAILVGGEIQGNRMYGGFDDSVLGRSVLLREEDGREIARPPKSQDTIATVLTALGMHMGTDFFLPGGFGEVAGIRS